MNLTFDFDDSAALGATMKVVGVGGAGCNAINRMIHEGLKGVEFVAINTDEQALEVCSAPNKIRIGTKTTHGLGAGADPEKGRRAVEEDRNAVYESLSDADMVFITAGMGGGTGTGAAPVVGEIARDIGALTVGIVTRPFLFEGPKRIARADDGIARLKENVDTLIVVPNERLLSIVPEDTPLNDAFRYADEVLFNATRGISDLISIPGLVNLDFADVRAVMSEMGDALMGSASARGENRAEEAGENAIRSPMLENVSIAGARGVLVNITGGPNLTLHEVNKATNVIYDEAGDEANIIFGAVIDKSIKDEIRITVIATGLSIHNGKRPSIPGLNRPPHQQPRTGTIPDREVPAVDRLDQISERLSQSAQSRMFVSSRKKEERHKRTPRLNWPERQKPHERYDDDDHPPKQPERSEDSEKEEKHEGEKRKPDSKLPTFSYKSHSNGFSDEDYEIPAIRRKKWNLF